MNHPDIIPFLGHFRSRMAQRMAGNPFTLFSATELGASKQQHFIGQMCTERCSNISLWLADLLARSSVVSDQPSSAADNLVTDQPESLLQLSQVHKRLSRSAIFHVPQRRLWSTWAADASLRVKAKDLCYVPDPNKAQDLEKLHERSLLKEFEDYRAFKGLQLKVFRLQAVRAGFKKAWPSVTTRPSSGSRVKSPNRSSRKGKTPYMVRPGINANRG
jgi:hypothetical protein